MRSFRSTAALLALPPALFALTLTAAENTANAGTSLAVPCDDDSVSCARAPIAYAFKDSLPIEWGFDTGWIPAGSPLQVHLMAGLYANTSISLSGDFVTDWPEAFLLTAPSKENGARLQFHYGLEVVAEALVSISVFGQNFSWTGPIPYVPQVDFQVEADENFDSWAFAPGHATSASSMVQKLAQVSVGNIIGGAIPGIDGGFELDAQVDLTATYITDRIVIRTTDGVEVPGGALVQADGQSTTPAIGGPSIDLDVNPEGHVDYDGTLHLIPAFYVSLLGQNWNIPVADVPIPFSTAQDWIFEPVRVHVPLPDVLVPPTEIDFGEVLVGDELARAFDVENNGEATGYAFVMVDDPSVFSLDEPVLTLAPGTGLTSLVRFAPTQGGHFEATVTVASNDPDTPSTLFKIRGDGVPLSTEILDAPEEVSQDGSCACEVVGTQKSGTDIAGLTFLAFFALGARRRGRAI